MPVYVKLEVPDGAVATAGHYVSFVKSHNKWLFFDDESVEAISEAMVQTAFGSPQEYNSSSMDHGYILMFTRQIDGLPLLDMSRQHSAHPTFKETAS